MNSKVDCLILGDVFLDFNMRVNIPSIGKGGVSYCDHVKYTYGGSGTIAAALSLLGISSYFVGKAGKDRYRKLYQQNLEKNNVKTRIFSDNYLPTGVLVSIIDNNAERSFLVSRGANDNLTADEIKDIIDGIDFDFIYVTGYSLVNSPQRDAILYAIRNAHDRGAKVFFDPGAFNTITLSKNYFKKVSELSNIISANLKEAKTLAQAHNTSDAVQILSEKVPLLVIRLGEEGCIVSSNEYKIKVPAPNVKAIDSTGAGDAFNAAFISGIIKKWSLNDIANFANWFAAKTTEQIGARSFPFKSEIIKVTKSFKREL
jgi:sugar/nucleoside kinase (ribokinase family)